MSNIVYKVPIKYSYINQTVNIQTSSNYQITGITSGSLTLSGEYTGDIESINGISWVGDLVNSPIIYIISASFPSASIIEPNVQSIGAPFISSTFTISYGGGNTTISTASNSAYYFKNNSSLNGYLNILYYTQSSTQTPHTASEYFQFSTGSLGELQVYVTGSTINKRTDRNDVLIDVSSSLISTNTKLSSVSSSLVATSISASNAYSLASDLNSIIPDANGGALTLNLTATAWNDTTPPSGSTITEEQKNDWSSGNIPIIRNSDRDGQPVFGVLGDPDGFLQIKLQSDLGGASGFSNVILFLPYYTSSYTP